MHALLGKITHITAKESSETGRDGARLEVRLKAACVLPQRGAVPEWLKDAPLTIERKVADAREVGHPGDSLVLTPAESARWLYPLAVTPGVTHGQPPPSLELRLRWWKEEKPPEVTVRANGRSLSVTLVKDGDGFAATVETAPFFEFVPRLPVTFEVTCDKLKAGCTVLPDQEPCCTRLLLPEGERYRLDNSWYAAEIVTRSHGGGIARLQEKGRGVDHFRRPEGMIQHALENAGHIDGFQTNWEWKDVLQDTRLACTGIRREGGVTRLAMDGVVDEGQNLHTSVVYALYDEMPLLQMEREFRFYKGKEKDGDDKEKAAKPKEPIDDMKPLSLGFRTAWIADREGPSASRVLWMEDGRLAAVRCARVGEWVGGEDWRISGGWSMAEHPHRGEAMLYLFDRTAPPFLHVGLGPYSLLMKPAWPYVPARPEESVGYSLALTAGELWGAAAEGAWVACRTPLPGGGVRCAAVGRLLDESAGGTVRFALGGDVRQAPLQRVLLPCVGSVFFASAEFPAGGMRDAFDVTFADIGPRRG